MIGSILQVFILLFFVVTSNLNVSFGDGSSNLLNLIDFGGKGDGKTDNFDAFSKAWKALCEADQNNPTLLIPEGSFLLKPITFQGPCKSDTISIKIEGNIIAPERGEWPSCNFANWLEFNGVNGLILQGSASATLDAQGSSWWTNQGITNKCPSPWPRALQIHESNNVEMSGVSVKNSPRAHIGINNCQHVTVFNTKITAPEDTHNTDGIDISQSSYVHVYDSDIGTGDDCIAINGGCSFINVTGVTCGPGHGISIGSLGKDDEEDTVEEVNVENCTFIKTQNGVRIKTWPGGSGYAKKISFSKITLEDAKNPIIIDQHYCNGEEKCPDEGEAVKVSGITYSEIKGTSASKQAITLDCAKIGCYNIVMDNINITSDQPPDDLHSFCNHVNGTSESTTPVVPCLQST